jgi:hypothetical protein
MAWKWEDAIKGVCAFFELNTLNAEGEGTRGLGPGTWGQRNWKRNENSSDEQRTTNSE